MPMKTTTKLWLAAAQGYPNAANSLKLLEGKDK